MHTTRRWSCLPAAGLGLALATLAGCQTWVPTAGLTLPSPHYLEHPPQYIPPSPAFPLTRELATQEAISARVAGAGAAVPLPPPKSGLSCGATRAGIRSSRTLTRWRLCTAMSPRFSIGANGSSVMSAAAQRSISW